MKKIILTVTVLITALIVFGQPPPPNPQPIPIDGGLGFLAAGGIALAAKKMFSKNKNLNK